MKAVKQSIPWSSIASRGLIFSLIWWVLSGAPAQSWWIGGPAVAIAVFVSIALIPPRVVVWHEFFRFVPYFLLRSLVGGIDVAWRVFHPRIPIAPDLVEYPLRLPAGLPRVIMINTVSLLPGTLVADEDQRVLKVHVLDGRSDFKTELVSLEQSLARMFAVPLSNE